MAPLHGLLFSLFDAFMSIVSIVSNAKIIYHEAHEEYRGLSSLFHKLDLVF